MIFSNILLFNDNECTIRGDGKPRLLCDPLCGYGDGIGSPMAFSIPKNILQFFLFNFGGEVTTSF